MCLAPVANLGTRLDIQAPQKYTFFFKCFWRNLDHSRRLLDPFGHLVHDLADLGYTTLDRFSGSSIRCIILPRKTQHDLTIAERISFRIGESTMFSSADHIPSR